MPTCPRNPVCPSDLFKIIMLPWAKPLGIAIYTKGIYSSLRLLLTKTGPHYKQVEQEQPPDAQGEIKGDWHHDPPLE